MIPFGSRVASIETPVPGPGSRAWMARLAAVESRNVTYRDDGLPVLWEEALGANVRDADGNVYVDLTAAFGVAFAGHRHPRVVEGVKRQAGRLLHGMGDVHPPTLKVELLERLASLAPWPGARGVLAGSGSEAVEVALKTGALASGRPGVLAFKGAYHGLTLGSLAATHRGHFRDPFEDRLFGGVVFAGFPKHEGDVGEAVDELRALLADGAPDGSPVGTVIVEPIQGRAGVLLPPDGFLDALIDVCHRAGCVVAYDEIFTGMGRTGSLFAGAPPPDLLCLGKALGGGLPIGVCMGRPEVMEAWPPSSGEAIHTSTFLGNPLCGAAALGFLDALEEDSLVERARTIGDELLRGLRAALTDVSGVGAIRGRGLMIGVELVDAGGRPRAGAAARVMTSALRRGVLVLGAGASGSVVEVTPPAVLTPDQAEFGIQVLRQSMLEIRERP